MPLSASAARFCSHCVTPSIWLCIFASICSVLIAVPALNSSNMLIWLSSAAETFDCSSVTELATLTATACMPASRLL